MLDKIFKQYIGRFVAWALAPVLLVAVPPVVHALNSALGTHFSNQQLSNIAIAIVVGLALVLYKWLHNRGKWENFLAWLEHVEKTGADVAGPPGPAPVGGAGGGGIPPVPPGS